MKNRRLRIMGWLATGLAIFTATGAASCSGNTHQSAQAAATDSSYAQVAQMPSGFRNFAFKCVELQGTWYAVFSGSIGGSGDNKSPALAAVADPTCKHYGP